MAGEIEALADACTAAHLAVTRTRAAWSRLYGALDVRAKAHAELELAKRACRDAADKLGIRTIPLNPAALAAMRLTAEAEAHETFKAARDALQAAQAVQPVASTNDMELSHD